MVTTRVTNCNLSFEFASLRCYCSITDKRVPANLLPRGLFFNLYYRLASLSRAF